MRSDEIGSSARVFPLCWASCGANQVLVPVARIFPIKANGFRNFRSCLIPVMAAPCSRHGIAGGRQPNFGPSESILRSQTTSMLDKIIEGLRAHRHVSTLIHHGSIPTIGGDDLTGHIVLNCETGCIHLVDLDNSGRVLSNENRIAKSFLDSPATYRYPTRGDQGRASASQARRNRLRSRRHNHPPTVTNPRTIAHVSGSGVTTGTENCSATRRPSQLRSPCGSN